MSVILDCYIPSLLVLAYSKTQMAASKLLSGKTTLLETFTQEFNSQVLNVLLNLKLCI